MAADLTTYDKILKEDYAPAIVKQINSKTVLLNRIKKDSTTIEGREFVVPTQGRRTEGVGSRSGTSSSLPTINEVGYDNAIYKPNYHWGQIQFSEVVIEHTKRETGAFIKAADSETKSLTETMGVDLNRQVYNDGTGLLSQTGVTTASTTVVLTTTGDYRALGNGQIRVGVPIDVLTRSTGAVIAAGRKVSAVQKAANTFTISGATITTATTDGIYRENNKVLTVNNEMAGLRNIVSTTGALATLDPSVAGQEYWASQVDANGGTNRSISEVLMQKLVDLVDENGQGKVSLLIAHYNTRRSYFNLLQSLKRFIKPLTLEGGFDALEFNGMPFVVDKDCKMECVYFLDESHLKWYELSKPSWMDGDGSILKWDQGTGYKAVYRWFVTFGTDARNALGVLDDITES